MPTPAPSTMRAWVYRKAGQPKDVLALESTWPTPTPQAGELLVKVDTAALNPLGYKIMSVFPLHLSVPKPAIPEQDWSGTVIAAAGELKVGERVCGYNTVGMRAGRGTLSEFMSLSPAIVARVPSSVSLEHAAALPCVGITAYWSLVNAVKLKKGDSLFINGGSTATGMMAIQIARSLGVKVVATGSAQTEELLKRLGADEVIDYRAVKDLPRCLKKHYSAAGKEFALIYDCVCSPELFDNSPSYLKSTGLYVDVARSRQIGGVLAAVSTAMGWLNRLYRPCWLGGTPRRYAFALVPPELQKEALNRLLEMMERGELEVLVDSSYAFGEVQKAYGRMQSGRARGKVIVRVAQ